MDTDECGVQCTDDFRPEVLASTDEDVSSSSSDSGDEEVIPEGCKAKASFDEKTIDEIIQEEKEEEADADMDEEDDEDSGADDSEGSLRDFIVKDDEVNEDASYHESEDDGASGSSDSGEESTGDEPDEEEDGVVRAVEPSEEEDGVVYTVKVDVKIPVERCCNKRSLKSASHE